MLTFADNLRTFEEGVCRVKDLADSIQAASSRAPTEYLEIIKTTFQRTVHDKLCQRSGYDAEMRIRYNQKRFKLNALRQRHPHLQLTVRTATPAWQAQRALRNIRALERLSTPRVRAAVFSTIWNRWVTARRFQKRDSAATRCVLHCGPGAEDSIEHYAYCPFTKQLAGRYVRLDPETHVNLLTFNMCNPHVKRKRTCSCQRC